MPVDQGVHVRLEHALQLFVHDGGLEYLLVVLVQVVNFEEVLLRRVHRLLQVLEHQEQHVVLLVDAEALEVVPRGVLAHHSVDFVGIELDRHVGDQRFLLLFGI